MKSSSLKQTIETIAAGVLYVGIGTIIAVQVSAQNSSKIPTSAATPAKSTACETNQSPDAMCSLPLQAGPDSKICFGSEHARCFELKSGHLVQTLAGRVAQDSTLDGPQTLNARSAMDAYSHWLETSLGQKPKSSGLCRELATVDSKAVHQEFCLSRLDKKEKQAKTNDLLLTLEHPTSIKSK